MNQFAYRMAPDSSAWERHDSAPLVTPGRLRGLAAALALYATLLGWVHPEHAFSGAGFVLLPLAMLAILPACVSSIRRVRSAGTVLRLVAGALGMAASLAVCALRFL